jgi:hypothetical protein
MTGLLIIFIFGGLIGFGTGSYLTQKWLRHQDYFNKWLALSEQFDGLANFHSKLRPETLISTKEHCECRWHQWWRRESPIEVRNR